MAVNPASLIAPRGEIHPDMFPGLDREALEERVAAYVSDGMTQFARSTGADAGNRDAAVRAWATHRAYTDAANALNASALAKALNDQGSVTRSFEQIRRWDARAGYWLDRFDALVQPASGARRPSRWSSTVVETQTVFS